MRNNRATRELCSLDPCRRLLQPEAHEGGEEEEPEQRVAGVRAELRRLERLHVRHNHHPARPDEAQRLAQGAGEARLLAVAVARVDDVALKLLVDRHEPRRALRRRVVLVRIRDRPRALRALAPRAVR